LGYEDGGSKVLRNIGILNTTRRHNPEDFDLNLHRRENLKSCNSIACSATAYNFYAYISAMRRDNSAW